MTLLLILGVLFIVSSSAVLYVSKTSDKDKSIIQTSSNPQLQSPTSITIPVTLNSTDFWDDLDNISDISPEDIGAAGTGQCPTGYAVQNTTSNGVQCVELDTGSIIDSWWPITGAIENNSGNLDVNEVALDFDIVQYRLQSNCSAGSSIRAIGSDGSIICESDSVGTDTNTWWPIDNSCLINQSGTLYFNTSCANDWARNVTSVYHVTTADAATLQSVINNIPEYSIVQFAPGIYNIYNIVINKTMIWKGSGNTYLRAKDSSVTGNLINITASSVVMEDLTVDARDYADTAIYVANSVNYPYFNRIWVNSFSEAGIKVGSNSYYGNYKDISSYLQTKHNGSIGIWFTNADNANNVIGGGKLGADYGIVINNSNNVNIENVFLEGDYTNYATATAVLIKGGSSNVKLSGNRYEAWNYGVNITPDSYYVDVFGGRFTDIAVQNVERTGHNDMYYNYMAQGDLQTGDAAITNLNVAGTFTADVDFSNLTNIPIDTDTPNYFLSGFDATSKTYSEIDYSVFPYLNVSGWINASKIYVTGRTYYIQTSDELYAAIDSCSGRACTIYLPAYTISLNRSLDFDANSRGMKIIGTSKIRSILELSPSFSDPSVFNFNESIDHEIKDVRIKFNGTNATGIYIGEGAISVRDVVLDGLCGVGVLMNNSYYSEIENIDVWSNNCNNSIGIYGIQANTNTITGGRIASDYGIVLDGPENVIIKEVSFEPSPDYTWEHSIGIDIFGNGCCSENGINNVIAHNRFENYNTDIRIQGGATGELYLEQNFPTSFTGLYPTAYDLVIDNQAGENYTLYRNDAVLSHPQYVEVDRGNMQVAYSFDQDAIDNTNRILYDGSGNMNLGGNFFPTTLYDFDGGRDGSGAIGFDGYNDRIELSSAKNQDSTSASFRMIVKFNHRDGATEEGLWSMIDGSGTRMYAVVTTGDQVRFMTGNGTSTTQELSAAEITQNDTWYEIVGTVDTDNDKICLYINGVLSDNSCQSITYSGGLFNYTGTVRVGQEYWSTGKFFNGTMDLFEIFPYALTQAQVRKMYEEKQNTIQPPVIAKRIFISTDTGYVGLGTTSPGAKLDVKGNMNISGNINATGSLEASTIDLNSRTSSTGIVWDGYTRMTAPGGSAIRIDSWHGLNVKAKGSSLANVAQIGTSSTVDTTFYGNVTSEGGVIISKSNSCLMLRDTDDAGWTKCTALNGVLSCATDADGVC